MVMFDDLVVLVDKLQDVLAELLLNASRAIQRNRNGRHAANTTEAPSTSGRAKSAVVDDILPSLKSQLLSLIPVSAPLVVLWWTLHFRMKRAESQVNSTTAPWCAIR